MDLTGLAPWLVGLHSIAAAWADNPALELSEEHAAKIAKAGGDVARWYPVTATQKGVDHLALAGVLFEVYGPMAAALAFGVKPVRQNVSRETIVPASAEMPIAYADAMNGTAPPPQPGGEMPEFMRPAPDLKPTRVQ